MGTAQPLRREPLELQGGRMRRCLAIVALGLTVCAGIAAGERAQPEPVTIRVDTAVSKGPMYPFWAWFGHDEPNYTYTPTG